jgi:hypothetical protein
MAQVLLMANDLLPKLPELAADREKCQRSELGHTGVARRDVGSVERLLPASERALGCGCRTKRVDAVSTTDVVAGD